MRRFLCLFLTFLSPLAASNRDIFKATFTTTAPAGSASRSFATFPEALRFFEQGPTEDDFVDLGAEFLNSFDLETIIPTLIAGYVAGTTEARLTFDFRGVDIFLRYPVVGGGDLEFAIPTAGFAESFTGGTRAQNFADFQEYIRENRKMILNIIMKEAVAHSPIDPVAGNPSSMMSKAIVDDFNLAKRPFLFSNRSACLKIYECVHSTPFRYHVETFYDQQKKGSWDLHQLGGRLNWSYFPLGHQGWQLFLDTVGRYGWIGKAEAWQGSLALGTKVYPCEHWMLTATGRGSANYSNDLAAGGLAVSGSLASDYCLGGENTSWSLRNLFGYYRTVQFSIGTLQLYPRIGYWAFKNGIGASREFCLFGLNIQSDWTLSVTNFTGERLYSDYYIEFESLYKLPDKLDHFRLSTRWLYADGNIWGGSIGLQIQP